MGNESSHRSTADNRHRRHVHSRHSQEREGLDDDVDEQPEERRHHRHKHRHPRRSLSPGEIPPPRKHRSRRLSPGEIPPPRRHRSRDSDKRHHKHTEYPKLQVKDPSPLKKDDPEEKVNPSQSPVESDASDSDEIFGPMPAKQEEIKRPPRRGEYGHDAKDIERFEQMGFVMSGNRRKRKYQQNVDEASKKSDFKLKKEEKALKETELVARFKEMIEERKGE